MKKRFTLILLLIISILCTGCASTSPITKSDFLLDTIVSITIYDSSSEEVLDGAFSLCKEYENLFSRTIEESDIYRLNHSNGQWTSISSDTVQLLSKGLYYSEISHGVFDITIGSVTELWDFKSETPEPPEYNEIQKALEHVNYKNLEIDSSSGTARLADPLSEIDLGGIAKGYIADKLKMYLINNGVNNAVINLGGNVLTIGSKNKQPFNIGIKKPFSETNELITSVQVGDICDFSSVVSSGAYERSYTYEGKLYHHIIDPRTGYPSDSSVSGVTILTKESVDGDALSTICFILGKEKGQELIDSQPITNTVNATALFY